MASKRALRRKACEGKNRYNDRAEAVYAAKAANRRTNSFWIVPYHCHFCNMWHIGHASENVKKSLRARGAR